MRMIPIPSLAISGSNHECPLWSPRPHPRSVHQKSAPWDQNQPFWPAQGAAGSHLKAGSRQFTVGVLTLSRLIHSSERETFSQIEQTKFVFNCQLLCSNVIVDRWGRKRPSLIRLQDKSNPIRCGIRDVLYLDFLALKVIVPESAGF